jgi:hypothetical protein
MKWLLESNVFDADLEPIVAEIVRQGHEYVMTERTLTRPEEVVPLFGERDCVVFYGSLGMAQLVRRHCPWVPGVYCDLSKYECTYYYPRLGKHLLNRDYAMLPFGELTRRREWVLDRFGVDGRVFVRPSSPFKIFGGRVIDSRKWDEEVRFLNFYTVEPERVVVVAAPTELLCEWRVVVVDGRAVCGSQYMRAGEIESGPCPDRVLGYAASVLAEAAYRPERAWCLDVCERAGGELSVLEVGAFSTCGLYQCPAEPVVREVARVAQEDWADIYRGV